MIKRLERSVTLIVIFVSAVCSSYGWDDVGHKVTSYIAWQRMTPDVREKVIKILLEAPEDAQLSTFYLPYGSRSDEAKKREFFMIASTWPDIVRDRNFENRYKKYHKGNWHYSDDFWTSTNGRIEFLKAPDDGGKAVEKLFEFEKLLRDPSDSTKEKAVAIAWIEHLVGDIHQPLHTSARVTETEPKGDQGGNLFHLTPQGTPREQQVNLHWYWDSIIGRNLARRNDACDSNYVDPIARNLMKKYPVTRLRNLQNGKYNDWQDEGVKLAIDQVFSSDLQRNQMPSNRYKAKAFRLAEEQLALAGYRMGEMFNSIFGTASAAK